VEGGIGDCGNIDYPGIYVRLEDPEVFEFLDNILNG
jgi:hypothetical protein